MAGGQGPPRRGGAPAIAGAVLRVGVHDLGQARAVRAWAAYHRRDVQLYGLDLEAAGAGFWRAVELRLGAPIVAECGSLAGPVVQALRGGLRHLRHEVTGPQAPALRALLEAHGAIRVVEPADLVLRADRPVAAQLACWSVVHDDRRHPACYETVVISDPTNHGTPPCD